ncbi:unnamed protein product, partial [Prorocentrum cordatum]
MSCRKRPAAALSALPRIDDVGRHAQAVRDIVTDHPDWGYRRVGARLGELLHVTLEESDYRQVLRLQKAEPVASAAYRNGWPDFSGNVRDYVDSIQELVASHPELGYWSIGRRLEQKLCVRLSIANLKVIDRIMQELSEGRAAVGAPQLEEFIGNVRDHAADFCGNVRDHVDSIQELVASHPECSYWSIGRMLEQKLCVRLSMANLKVIDRIMQELSQGRAAVGAPQLEEFIGNVRDHADSIRALVAAHPGMGYWGISKEFEKHIRLRLSPAHMQTVRRIVDGISQARAAPSTQRDTDNYEVASADVRDHAATIMELTTRHPTMEYHGIAVELEKVLGVELSQSQKEGISSVMAEISIDLVTDDEAMPEESEVGDIFSGSVRDHVGSIKELMASHPDDGYRSIGSMLGQRLGVKLSTAHLQVIYRIMKELSEGRAVEPDWGEFSGDVRHHVDSIRALVALHPGLGYKGIAHELGQHIRQNLSQAHVKVIKRIVDGISRGRAVSQRALSDCAEGAVDVRDHVETIEELMMQDPSLDYQGIARQLEDKLQVQLSDGLKQAICGLMAQIGIHLLADDKSAPEPLDIEAFNGDVREHVDAIRDLVAYHPDSGCKVIGSVMGEQLGVRLQYAHLQVVHRVMTELAEGRAAVGVAIRQQPERQNYLVFTGNLRGHSGAIRELLTLHPTAGRGFILRELGFLIGRPCGSFLSYLRVHKLADGDHNRVIERRGRGDDSRVAVGVRYAFEMQDNFIGQFCTMMFPHGAPGTFVPPLDSDPELIPFTKHYLKAVKYLRHLVCLKGTRPACEQSIRRQVQAMLPREAGDAEEVYDARVLSKMQSTRWVGFATEANRIADLCDASVESIGNRLHEYSWEPFDSWPWRPPRDSDSEDAPVRPGVQLFHPLRCADDAEGAHGKPFHCVDAALEYLEDVVGADLRIRVSLGRALSFRARLHAAHVYFNHMQFCFDHPEAIPPDVRRRADCLLPDRQNRYYEQCKKEWRRCQAHARPRITWSADQQEVLKVVDGVLSRADANIVQQQFYYVNGGPGSGKTEVLCEAARRAADAGLQVLILGPTGTLVHTYKTKVQHDNINVETIHSAWHIYRRADTVVDYAPPSRLRTYDLFIIAEASQIEDDVAVRLHNGFRELPQRPTIFFAADFQQLNPLGSSSAMRTWITVMTTISLFTIHRTNDDRLLSFLRNVRVMQPSKAVIRAFFAGRTWDSISLEQAVRRGMHLGAIRDEPFHWLTVTNEGAEAVNLACLSACGYDKPENLSPLCGDLK